jgi:hypothetical protein
MRILAAADENSMRILAAVDLALLTYRHRRKAGPGSRTPAWRPHHEEPGPESCTPIHRVKSFTDARHKVPVYDNTCCD